MNPSPLTPVQLQYKRTSVKSGKHLYLGKVCKIDTRLSFFHTSNSYLSLIVRSYNHFYSSLHLVWLLPSVVKTMAFRCGQIRCYKHVLVLFQAYLNIKVKENSYSQIWHALMMVKVRCQVFTQVKSTSLCLTSPLQRAKLRAGKSSEQLTLKFTTFTRWADTCTTTGDENRLHNTDLKCTFLCTDTSRRREHLVCFKDNQKPNYKGQNVLIEDTRTNISLSIQQKVSKTSS